MVPVNLNHIHMAMVSPNVDSGDEMGMKRTLDGSVHY